MTVLATQHGADCGCTRCAGFEVGNEVGRRFEPRNGAALSHGCYSPIRLQPRAVELREQLAPLVPFGTEADGPLVDLLGFKLAQVERAAITLAVEQGRHARAAEAGEDAEAVEDAAPRLERLASDSRQWVRTASRLLDQLGLSPTSRARLAGDLAGAERTLTAKALRDQYGAEVA